MPPVLHRHLGVELARKNVNQLGALEMSFLYLDNLCFIRRPIFIFHFEHLNCVFRCCCPCVFLYLYVFLLQVEIVNKFSSHIKADVCEPILVSNSDVKAIFKHQLGDILLKIEKRMRELFPLH